MQHSLTRGFHLLEIMITLIIVSILIGIAIPAYTGYVTRAHRLSAAVQLTKLASQFEQYNITHVTQNAVLTHELNMANESSTRYHFRLVILDEHHTQLLAEPIGTQAEHDLACGTLILDSLGEKQVSGYQRAERCWSFA